MAKWIKFVLVPREEHPNRKTDIWDVMTLDNIALGEIKWYSAWRKYSFFPLADTIYENDCLKDIANFIEERMKERKK